MNDMLFWAFAGLAAFVVIVRLFFWLLILPAWWKKGRKDADNSNLPPLSVVIAARNEADNLEKFLPSVLQQD
ncbi:MAG: hypothetical protein ACOCXO_02800, partial [Bacteroidota bacterium]